MDEQTDSGIVTLKDVKANAHVKAYIDGANAVLSSMGYTEHGHRHSGIVSSITKYILKNHGASERDCELGAIAGYVHDIGNVVNRLEHPQVGATIAERLLTDMGMPPEEIAPVLGAIGNHEALKGYPVSDISAALIIADKSDVHLSRVQNKKYETFDIHDRVNYAVQKSRIEMSEGNSDITLVMEIDTTVAGVMEYFEIFLDRMIMCRLSAGVLGYKFKMDINGTVLA